MTNTKSFAWFLSGISVMLLISCSKPIEKQIPGTWKVDDVAYVDASSQFDLDALKATAEEQKTLKFVLKKNDSLNVLTGFSTFKGKWFYNKDKQTISIVYEGSPDTLLMGKWSDGKIINEEKSTAITIKTTFVKEK